MINDAGFIMQATANVNNIDVQVKLGNCALMEEDRLLERTCFKTQGLPADTHKRLRGSLGTAQGQGQAK